MMVGAFFRVERHPTISFQCRRRRSTANIDIGQEKKQVPSFCFEKKDVSNDADVVSNCFNFNDAAFCFLVSSQEKETKSDFPTRLSKTQWSLSQRNHPL